MQDKETLWHQKRLGKITSSNLHLLNSKSGKWTQTAMSYLYSLQRQRWLKQPKKSIATYAMQIGIDNEPYAIDWLRKNTTLINIEHCDVDFDEKIFIETDWGLGDSPDGYGYDMHGEKYVIEIKCMVSETSLAWFYSPTVPPLDKAKYIFEEHKNQMAGHLLAHPDIDKVLLFIYDPQDDDDINDLRDTLDPSRGQYFVFTRSQFGDLLDKTKERVIIAEAWLQSGENLEAMKRYENVEDYIANERRL